MNRPGRAPLQPTLAAIRLGSDPAARLRCSPRSDPRAAVCGMGVCQECAIDVDGQRRLACQTLARAAPATVPRSDASLQADVVIIGAGPAGLAAAQTAAAAGARVVLVDDNPYPGGQIWRDGPGVDLPSVAQKLRDAVVGSPEVRLLTGHRVVAAPGPRTVLLEHDAGALRVSGTRLILATGARELLLPFPGWTLPGVTGAGGLQALIKGGLDVRGQRIVVAGSGPLLLAVADTARRAGARVLHVLEQARAPGVAAFAAGLWRWPGKAWQALLLRPPGYRAGSHVVQAAGQGRVDRVRIHTGSREIEVPCDRLACGFGLVPNHELAQLLGCAVDPAGRVLADELQRTSQADVLAVGECCGVGGADAARVQGEIAGRVATDQAIAPRLLRQRARWQRFSQALDRHFALRDEVRRLADAGTVVCRCEDVTHSELEGREGWIDAKLHTRCGMGPCQGRVCGAALRQLFGWDLPVQRHTVQPLRVDSLVSLGEP